MGARPLPFVFQPPGCGGGGDRNKKTLLKQRLGGRFTGTVGDSLPSERGTLRVRELIQPGRLNKEAICRLH